MALLQVQNLHLAYGLLPLLEGVGFTLHPGERVGLLGPNGAGKSSLLKLVAKVIEPDQGELRFSPGTRVGYLPQEVPTDLRGTTREIVAAGLPPTGQPHEVERVLSQIELDPEILVENLSAGKMRRVLLARALVAQPDLLLLDEPTNHLDVASIEWLESFLRRWGGTLLFITHDRAFLRSLANRILEIDRGRLIDFDCGYDEALRRRESLELEEAKDRERERVKLQQEEAWLRQGLKARRTRNEGRLRALKQLREERASRRDKLGAAKIDVQEASRSGKLVTELENVHFAYDGHELINGLTCRILRGDKVGILGPNGAGKSTLLKLILGRLQPQKGTVRLGTKLEIAFFDQLREQLEPEKSVQENIAGDYESIGRDGRHILSYLQDFLFTPERARTPVKALSGGERVRVLLARLFCRPANLLVMDEPTNDLDLETLELLEDRLANFAGTVLLVSHDRDFLDNVVGSTLVFEDGGVKEYVGGYEDWQRQRKRQEREVEKVAREIQVTAPEKPSTRKLSFKEKRELDALPGRIEALESELESVRNTLSDPAFYQQDDKAAIAAVPKKLEELEKELANCYGRWEELDSPD